MGYYTKFWLTIEQGLIDDFGKVYDLLSKIVTDGQGSPFYYEADSDQLSSDDTMTWYDHDEDCAEMSKSFPDVTFCLEGQGEEASDTWKSYYRNGLMQISRAIITYPPFDPTKLKSVFEAQSNDNGRP
jgi:hypothetical protein